MAVLAVIIDETKAAAMTRWACQFAQAENQPLSIILATERAPVKASEEDPETVDPVLKTIRDTLAQAHCAPDEKSAEEVKSADGEDEAEVVRRLESDDRQEAIMKEIEMQKPKLLIIGKHVSDKSEDVNAVLARNLFENAPCNTLLLRPADTDGTDCDSILVPTAGGPHSRFALQLASRVVQVNEGVVSPLYIEPNTGEVATEVGQRVLGGLMKNASLEPGDHMQPQVVVADDVSAGIREAASKEHDLLLIGDSNSGQLRRRLFGTVPERLLTGKYAMAIGVVRRAKPMGELLRRKLEQWLHFRIPQLEREDRINLFESLQLNSRWSFDFMALISLATAIAALGLILNSTAVVIGAMLVAPLMTPLLGAGLALVQGNLPLMKTCARAIVYGFFAALAIGIVMGFVTPIRQLTPEMAARGGPTLLDMAVAFLSGVAASYCVARPRLTAALAGVAIAAALVPPIATTGIAIALGEVAVARGAAELFATNVVAIILGAAINFYAAGIRGAVTTGGNMWARRTVLGLIAAAAVLAIPLGSALLSQAIEQRAKQPTVPLELRTALQQASTERDAGRISAVSADKILDDWVLNVTLEAERAPDTSLAQEFGRLAAKTILNSTNHRDIEVRVVTTLVIGN